MQEIVKSNLSAEEQSDIHSRLNQLKQTSSILKNADTALRNSVLENLIQKIDQNQKEILLANQKDLLELSKHHNASAAFVERLTLNEKRLQQMKDSLKSVIRYKDPVNERIDSKTLKNGLFLERIRSPLGVCFMIFESRPNVITEAFSLAFKSGNALLLKGGKESDQTSQIIYQLIRESLPSQLQNVFWGLIGAPRVMTDYLVRQNKYIDVLIPRGGDRLMEYVTLHSTLPLIKNDRGLCHIYVHRSAKLDMALNIVDNAKTQRPGVCNAMETLLIDKEIAPVFFSKVHSHLSKKNVIFHVCPDTFKMLLSQTEALPQNVELATSTSFDTEYLDLEVNVKLVSDVNEAISHIEDHGSRHSEAIITEDTEVAQHFQKCVDAAVVYWNASTRFTDGYEFGLGGEMGISTQKTHVRGPVGLEALTTPRWIVRGQGQIRS